MSMIGAVLTVGEALLPGVPVSWVGDAVMTVVE